MQASMRKWISTGGTLISRAIGLGLVLTACSTASWAGPLMPEIDPGLATSAMALLGGGLLLIAGRRPRR